MNKFLLLSIGILALTLTSCEKEECSGMKKAIVYRFPDRENEFELNFPYDCETGQPIKDSYNSSYIVFVRWA